uniref:Uncharacterized protein n=1 Tax=viral metagenome TaxID=1070528 RepID=A0A6C0AYN7_9ZZZZ
MRKNNFGEAIGTITSFIYLIILIAIISFMIYNAKNEVLIFQFDPTSLNLPLK